VPSATSGFSNEKLGTEIGAAKVLSDATKSIAMPQQRLVFILFSLLPD